MLRMDVQERRNRLAVRHRLASGHAAGDPLEAARSVVCLHATDPATVYLSVWARTEGFAREELDEQLYETRSLVKHMAMRRTLWVVSRELLPAVQSVASDRVAGAERRRLVKAVEMAGLKEDGAGWLDEACAAVCAELAGGREATSAELKAEIAALEGGTFYGEGKSWGGEVPVAPRVLTVLSADGRIVRASNDGNWYVSRPRWTAMEAWLGEPLERMEPAEASMVLVERWLRAFGPGTTEDIKWWLGGTLTAVRQALADLEVVEVDLDGAKGWLLPDDLEPTPQPEPWVALLPGLDPTTMGWKQRAFYLGDYKDDLFDRAGNAGPTAWCDGRIVGGWRQTEHGEVVLQLLEDVGTEHEQALQSEAARLTEWCGGRRVMPRFPSPLSKRFAA